MAKANNWPKHQKGVKKIGDKLKFFPILLLLWVAVACGDVTTESATPKTVPSTTITIAPAPSQPTKLTPCSLLSTTDVQALLPGYKYNPPFETEKVAPSNNYLISTCLYVFGATQSGTDFVNITIYQAIPNHKKTWAELYRQVWDSELRADLQQIQNVPNVGEAAFFADNTTLYVLQNKKIFSLTIYDARPRNLTSLTAPARQILTSLANFPGGK